MYLQLSTPASQEIWLPQVLLLQCIASVFTLLHTFQLFVRESVDSLCRDGANAQYMQILKQKSCNFITNTLKAYLSTQASSVSAFVISKAHTSGQKPRERQLSAKVCNSKSAICHILSFFLHYDFCSNNNNSKTAQVLTLILARN